MACLEPIAPLIMLGDGARVSDMDDDALGIVFRHLDPKTRCHIPKDAAHSDEDSDRQL